MAIHELKEQIARLPEQPGVYLYFNADGDTIYVGKARALRDRVRNYLGGYGSDPKRDALLDEIARLEVIVTDSVVEAHHFVEQRVRLGIGTVGAEVGADPVAQGAGLADVDRVAVRVEVQIDPGLLRQPGNLLLEFVDGHTVLWRVFAQCVNPPF